MPREIFGPEYMFLDRGELLSLEEIDHLAGLFVNLGIEKIRLTGGEPLVRRNVEWLIEKLARYPQIDLTMTTNGSLLKQKAKVLKDAGLKRISVSLDSLEDDIFAAMNDAEFPVAGVLGGIEAAREVGLKPIKINMVVKRGVNEVSILPMARHFRGTGDVVRFIEFMDVGTTNGWRLDEVVPASEIIALIDAEFPLEPVEQGYRGEVARRYRYKDGGGEIGVIASVTQPFCGDCTRLRLSADGMLYTCLFASTGFNMRDLMRSGASDEDILAAITSLWSAREDRYSEVRSSETIGLPKVEMFYIGG
jgi:cyclic pyranopterin phosphate synthase